MKTVFAWIKRLLPHSELPLRQNEHAQRTLLLLLAPLTAFWLMQFVLGAMPWQINFGAAAANWLCLGAFYWIACGVFGAAHPSCHGISAR